MRKTHVGEQVGRSWSKMALKPGSKRYARMLSHRKMRRLAKRDPENAPRKYQFRGWWD